MRPKIFGHAERGTTKFSADLLSLRSVQQIAELGEKLFS
jgi:hypothetical protein